MQRHDWAVKGLVVILAVALGSLFSVCMGWPAWQGGLASLVGAACAAAFAPVLV